MERLEDAFKLRVFVTQKNMYICHQCNIKNKKQSINK